MSYAEQHRLVVQQLLASKTAISRRSATEIECMDKAGSNG